jgi:methyl-accepting chemotaxis protein
MKEGRERVREGLALSAQTGKALERIVSGAEEIQKRVKEMARAHAAQAEVSEALTLRIHSLSAQAVDSAAGVEQIVKSVEDLEARARQLKEMVARFQVEAPGGEAPPRHAAVTGRVSTSS